MSRYHCKRCGCRLDPADRIPYPGEGDVCEECAEELDQEAEHRRLFCLTKEQQKDIKKILPGCRLGTDMDHENRKRLRSLLA